jgi:hypothetical protein
MQRVVKIRALVGHDVPERGERIHPVREGGVVEKGYEKVMVDESNGAIP